MSCDTDQGSLILGKIKWKIKPFWITMPYYADYKCLHEYLFEVWYWQELLQPWQELPHQSLQSRVILGSILHRKNVLQRTYAEESINNSIRQLDWFLILRRNWFVYASTKYLKEMFSSNWISKQVVNQVMEIGFRHVCLCNTRLKNQTLVENMISQLL